MNTLHSVGIDIAKAKFDVAFLNVDRSSTHEVYENSKEGISRFIRELKKQRTASTVPCVLESTGIYHLPVALMVSNAGFRVNCINPLITKKYQRSSVRNAKSDPIDALRLAEVGVYEKNLQLFSANNEAINLKRIVSYINSLEKVLQQMKASLSGVEEMREMTGLSVDLRAIKKSIAYMEKEIEILIKETIEKTSKKVVSIADETPGVSREKLSVLLALLSDKTFYSRDALVAYVGLDVTVRQSGTWMGKGRLSKRGNAYARKILFQMAWGLKQHNERYMIRYKELREKGKDYRTSMIILARTFLRFLYAVYFKEKSQTISA